MKRLSAWTWQPIVQRRIAKTRLFRHKELTLTIPPGVFHPGYFFSTKIFLRYLETLSWRGLHVLELGCGSGLIALSLAKQGAIVTASDINLTAVSNLQKNAAENTITLRAVHSDLFAQLAGERFDRILVNPPFFPKQPLTEAEYAWYCGADWSYFRRLFGTAEKALHPDGMLIMILSEDCDHPQILAIARENGFAESRVLSKRNWWENNTIYTFQMRKIGS